MPLISGSELKPFMFIRLRWTATGAALIDFGMFNLFYDTESFIDGAPMESSLVMIEGL
jgi:hypothetical protein